MAERLWLHSLQDATRDASLLSEARSRRGESPHIAILPANLVSLLKSEKEARGEWTQRLMDKERCLKKGTILQGVYRIKKAIATSELSNVYVVYQMRAKKTRILKEFFPRSLAMRDLDHRSVICRTPSAKGRFATLLESFWQEAAILQELHHEHIASYVDHFAENGTAYLVIELCKGKTLDQYMQKQQELEVGSFLRTIVLPLISGLDYLHKQGIIHRDIKPQNIIVTDEGKPMLIDFGSAVRIDTHEPRQIVTTEGYSPLEFYSGKSRQGVFSDVYSLSATLYFCLTGQRPADVAARVIEDRLPSVRELNAAVPRLLSNVISWGMAVEAKKRCPSLRVLEAAVRAEHLLQKGKLRLPLPFLAGKN